MELAIVEIRVPATSRITIDTADNLITIRIGMTIDSTEGDSLDPEHRHSGKISPFELKTMIDSIAPDCDTYWDHAAWLPPWYILDRWCQRDDRCRQAKYEALLTACEQGEVKYSRRDGKDFDDPVRELADRRILVIDRISFDIWAAGLEGQSPLAQPPRPKIPLPPLPAWAHAQRSQAPGITAPATTNLPPPDIAPKQETADHGDAVPPSTTSTIPNLTPPAGDVPTDEIIAAFPVRADEKANSKWWKDRMSEALDYGLTDARTHRGRLNDPSRWRPDGIALWLVSKGHMKAKVVKRIVARNFPDWADIVDHFIDG